MGVEFERKASKLINSEGWVAILANLLLFFLKYWAGIVSGSLALIADAWHTLSDSISSVILLIGNRYTRKPADKGHPFGHGRSELITSILIGSILGFVAFFFALEGYDKLHSHEGSNYGTIALAVTIISILTKEALAQYAFFVGRKTKSNSVIADGWHHRSDALSSVIVLVGIFVGKYFWWIDGALSIAVALLILYSGFKIIADSASVILGERPDPATIESVKKIVNRLGIDGMAPHHFHIHNYVMHHELTFHVRLPNEMSIEQAHRIVSNIESAILNELGIDATIHIEPFITDKNCKHID